MGSNPSWNVECGLECPVEQVSWLDSAYFLNALSRAAGLEECYVLSGCTGVPGDGCPPNNVLACYGFDCEQVDFAGLDCRGFRFPTEAEWEYSARATTQTAYYTGDAMPRDCMGPTCCDDANLDRAGWYCYNSGVLPAEAESLHPVARKESNAWGLFDMHGNVEEPVQDEWSMYQREAVDPLAVGSEHSRIMRGGAWYYSHVGVRSAYRGESLVHYRHSGQGLRPALTLELSQNERVMRQRATGARGPRR